MPAVALAAKPKLDGLFGRDSYFESPQPERNGKSNAIAYALGCAEADADEHAHARRATKRRTTCATCFTSSLYRAPP